MRKFLRLIAPLAGIAAAIGIALPAGAAPTAAQRPADTTTYLVSSDGHIWDNTSDNLGWASHSHSTELDVQSLTNGSETLISISGSNACLTAAHDGDTIPVNSDCTSIPEGSEWTVHSTTVNGVTTYTFSNNKLASDGFCSGTNSPLPYLSSPQSGSELDISCVGTAQFYPPGALWQTSSS